MNIFKSRKFRQGSLATAITALGVALIILLNVVVSTLGGRLGWSLDLTKEKLFEITQDTRDFLSGLQKDVNIYVLNSEEGFLANSPQQYMTQANEVIKKYEQLSPRISVSYVDIVKTPTFVAQYSDLALKSNQILIESPGSNQRTVVNYLDLFNTQTNDYGQQQVRSSKAEQVMTSAILNVTSDKKIRVTVLEGHNEGDMAPFTDLLKANNFEIVTQNLATEQEVDPEATIALLATPARDLSEDELRKLDRFLSNDNRFGRTLLYVASGDQPSISTLPNLTAWLGEWGIGVGDSIVFEADWNLRLSPTDPRISYVNYAEDEYSTTLKEKKLYPAMVFSKPLSLLYSEKSARTTRTLLQSSAQSGVMPEDTTGWQPSDKDMTGPIPTLVMSTETRYDQFTPLQSHVVASGSYYAFDQQFLGGVNYANSEYYLGLFNVLAGREDTVKIQDKTISTDTMEMTAGQVYTLGLTMLALVPLALLVAGIVVWVRRRHR